MLLALISMLAQELASTRAILYSVDTVACVWLTKEARATMTKFTFHIFGVFGAEQLSNPMIKSIVIRCATTARILIRSFMQRRFGSGKKKKPTVQGWAKERSLGCG